MRPLSIAYDAGPLLDPPTGVGRYTAELAAALEARGHGVRRYAVAAGGTAPPGVRRLRVPARSAQWAWRRWGRPALGRLVGEVDLFHGTNFVLPPLGETPGVVTVHDLSFLRSDTFPGGGRLRDLVPWSVRRARRVITPTAAVGDELAAWAGIARDNIDVTPEGVSAHFFGASPLSSGALGELGIGGPYVVAVGTIEPRKNLPRLLEAWRLAARKDLTLVLAGPKGWGAELDPVPGVVLPGWVEEASLPGLLAAAEFFCYPSVYEGFGLPPLEAMAAGTPVIAGRNEATAEVLGESGLLFDPSSTEDLADCIARFATDADLRRRYSMVGRARAAGFTWDRTARATEDAYGSALGMPETSGG